ncbi:MAG: aldehyde dehydrogenase family protein [Phycisphaeraceae bacterium]|nr:aldehyde dehydrogenase family protein [Phycisphaeraceae bacterium]
MDPALGRPAVHEVIESRNPARPDEIVWRGEATIEVLDAAVRRARKAAPAWARRPESERVALLECWREVTASRAEELAQLITREMGKTLDESRAEAKLLGEKVVVTLAEGSRSRVRDFTVEVPAGRRGECRFRPYGVMAVVGPFNFPAHLPNGHWVPALLLGNCVIFKPSDRTPGVGAMLGEMARQAGFPEGVFEVVQGASAVARALVAHPDIDGILFTGSWPVGRAILEANLDRPGRIVALELGGSNPALVLPDVASAGDGFGAGGGSLFDHAVLECMRAAFITTGQRCTCTRRIIVHRSVAPRFIEALVRAAARCTAGPGDASPAPFMGPLVSRAARDAVFAFVAEHERRGSRVHLRPEALDAPGWFVTPGVIEVERFDRATDCECFGPVVQVAAVDSLEAMIAQANATDFGLAASVFTADERAWNECRESIRSGLVNWNCGTAGASGKLPFGGLGRSGNLRPAGAFSVDYCAFPKASMIEAPPRR